MATKQQRMTRFTRLIADLSTLYVPMRSDQCPTRPYADRYLPIALLSVETSGIMKSSSDENYAGDLLNFIIAELTDDLVGFLTIERDAMTRTIIEIRSSTLRGSPVRVCGMTFEMSW